MSTTMSRRRMMGASALTMVGTVGAVLTAEALTGIAPHRGLSPTDRVAPRPQDSTVACRTEVFWRAHPAERLISLTFDDGPDPRWTPQVLDALAAHDARATFFQMGDAVVEHPEITRDVHAAGHEIASHGSGHLDLSTMSVDAIRENLGSTHDAIAATTGTAPTLVRPPWGRIDAPGLLVASELGYDVALWSHHLPTEKAEKVVDTDVATASPGMVVLCHDGRGTPADSLYVAVRRLLAELTDEGYTFVSVSELRAAEQVAV